ncbi:RNA recognition motif domain-containing protein [Nitrosococcus oceani]|uniref:RNA-binding protein, RNP-1 n=2 Tax=Nitrosococcus oceani TaxID=1229 RepID=Q3J7Y3_NITOC|nr:RNA-binding protein [Nitrosococcus oceani]KFI18488.1 RNA-binding protein [Nitrosococcus oceani C-27]ABA59063.1 RNA-binding protein, RNP-1 [Nitrosococcus oceani ATCC 19707]EDZ66313.1 RNA-binding protein, putative [Nitrosococcus oceani AFC27]KFI21715.1 RNA-binding protein [Nitrosococcus oceani]GEM21175.1 RNA-binding protein [Nitrosococcus oceani]
MITLFIRGLPTSTTEESLTALFADYGTVRSLTLHKDLFTGQARGTALINMEGHEGRAAIAALDGSQLQGRTIYVNQTKEEKRRGRGGRRRR